MGYSTAAEWRSQDHARRAAWARGKAVVNPASECPRGSPGGHAAEDITTSTLTAESGSSARAGRRLSFGAQPSLAIMTSPISSRLAGGVLDQAFLACSGRPDGHLTSPSAPPCRRRGSSTSPERQVPRLRRTHGGPLEAVIDAAGDRGEGTTRKLCRVDTRTVSGALCHQARPPVLYVTAVRRRLTPEVRVDRVAPGLTSSRYSAHMDFTPLIRHSIRGPRLFAPRAHGHAQRLSELPLATFHYDAKLRICYRFRNLTLRQLGRYAA